MDARTQLIVDTAAGLASTVLAIRACDPAEAVENARFTCEWDALNLDVPLVLIAADPGSIGAEIAAYIVRHFAHRQVHVVIGSTPAATEHLPLVCDQHYWPAAQLERSLHQLTNVVLHWIIVRDRGLFATRRPLPYARKARGKQGPTRTNPTR